MFWNKRLRETDKIICSGDGEATEADPSVIDIRINSQEQVFSAYSYSADKLNAEFGEYILDKAKRVPVKDTVKIRIHAETELNGVEQAIKNHFRDAYKETKKEIKRIVAISTVMTLLGIIALTALILVTHFTENIYVTSIIEIAAWVFIWEAVDYFFLQRPVIKARCILIQRIFTSIIEICKEPV